MSGKPWENFDGYGFPNVEDIAIKGTIKVKSKFENEGFNSLQEEIYQKTMKTLTLLESHQSVGEYHLQCESSPVLTRQDDGIRCEQSYQIVIPLLMDQTYEIKGTEGLIPGVKVTSQAWPCLNTPDGVKSTITDSKTTSITTSKTIEKTESGRILLHVQTKLTVKARLRIENMTRVAPMTSTTIDNIPQTVDPIYSVEDEVADSGEGYVTVVKTPTKSSPDVDHLRNVLDMIKLGPDPLISPCDTPLSSRPSSVLSTSMVDSAVISDMTTDSDFDASSSIFSEDVDDTIEDPMNFPQKPIIQSTNPQKQNSANNSVEPNWNGIASL